MDTEISGLKSHRVQANGLDSVDVGEVQYSPIKSLWFLGMAGSALVGGVATFSLEAVMVFALSTGTVLLLGHSLGSHRKLIHNSYQCPKWLEYILVYFGVQVGLAGPLGLLRQHELRDFAQRLPQCHNYLRHGSSFWKDAWWQLNCELRLSHPPRLNIEKRIGDDRFYQWLEKTWMLQQLPPAILLHAIGGWAYVFWGVCARVTAGVFGHWLIGYFAHNHGDMNYEVQNAAVQGRNIRFTSLLTMGESWHNNHHAFPGSAKLGLYPDEWDPGWWALLILRKLGLVWDIRLPSHLPHRPELLAYRETPGVPTNSDLPPTIGVRPAISLVQTLKAHMALIPSAETASMAASGPAEVVSKKALQTICGSKVQFQQDPRAARLSLSHQGRTIFGLPALCFALCIRAFPLRILGLTLLPLAIGFEYLRCKFEMAGS